MAKRELPAFLTLLKDLSAEVLSARRESANSLSKLENIQSRLQSLEQDLRESLPSGGAGTVSPSPPPAAIPVATKVAAAPQLRPQSKPQFMPPPAPRSVPKGEREIKFGQRGLLIVGVVLVVLGIGYFLKYSFDQNWIGPAGRVALSYLAGIVLLGLGDGFRRKKFDVFGLFIIGGGIATLYFSSYAGFQIYQLFSQTIAFGLMILVTILASTLAVFYNNKGLAVLGLIGGFVTPAVLSTGQDNQVALMTYASILNLGILGIALFKRWNFLNWLGFVFTWLLFSSWFEAYYETGKFPLTILFLHVFFLIYAVTPYLYYFFRQTKTDISGLTISVLGAFVAFGYAYFMIKEVSTLPMVGVVTLGYATLYAGMAHVLYRRHRENTQPLFMMLATAALFLIITIPVLFSQHWITIFWSVQALCLLWAAGRLKSDGLSAGGVILLFVTAGKFAVYDLFFIFDFDILNFEYTEDYTFGLIERYLTTLLVLGSFYGGSVIVRKYAGALKQMSAVLLVFFVVGLFVILNMEVSGFFAEYAAAARFASVSVLWTLYSITLMIFGFVKKQAVLRRSAIILFVFTILKVFLFDMANVATPFRIVSFIVLGIVLVAASYLYYRYKDRILGIT